MTEHSTALNSSVHGSATLRQVNESVIIVEVLVGIFLCVNGLMIFTFFKKEFFRSNVRYILFVHTLFCDSAFLAGTNVILVLSYFSIPIVVGLCLCISFFLSLLTFATPLTLMAMTVERYVAICLPLQHAEISTPSKAIRCIPIILALSSIQMIITTSVFASTAPLSVYTAERVCSVEVFIVYRWQGHLRSAISQFYFLVISSVVVFAYVKIWSAARLASTDKKSANKGLKTVALHAIQLFLCLIWLWCPFIEMALLEIDFQLFVKVRYFDYIVFTLLPRCLSPLVYGLRDERFFKTLKNIGLCKEISPEVSGSQ